MKKKTVLIILGVIILLAGFTAWKFFGPTVHPPEKKYFFVHTGATMEEVKTSLIDQRIIGGDRWFGWASRMTGFSQVRPGRYEITRGMSVFGLVRRLKNGNQSPVNFVVTKIRTRDVLASRIGNAFECDSTQMINFLNSSDSLQAYDLDSNTVMAVVMPYTYTSKWNTTPGRLFQQFDIAWKKFWTPDRRQKADSLRLTPLQVSTLASIIDEETNAPSDRGNIASVYLNRMAKGIPLQADPTVKFALKNFGLRRIYEDYTRIPSPFNTYVNKGLPPGPICTPATATIDAVLDSPKTNYLYFVASSNFNGTHVFTTDYKEHMKYARLYQEELNKRNIK